MKLSSFVKRGVLLAAILIAPPGHASAESQVLAVAGDMIVSADELESAMVSSPFATGFPTMEQEDQALLRGALLQRLVASKLFYQEAKRLELDKTAAYKKDIEGFRLGLLYRRFMDKLREEISIPGEVQASIREKHPQDSDKVAAAEALFLSEQYRVMRYLAMQKLRRSYHLKVFESRIQPGKMRDDTVLLEGDGFHITYKDAVGNQLNPPQEKHWLMDRLNMRAELLMVARAAKEEGIDVSDSVASYSKERLPAMLIEQKQREWTSNTDQLKKYYDAHPEFGRTLERRHIGQVVLSSREEAQDVRQRINAGESLFLLASELSIDPYGKNMRGDMGWVKEGTGHPDIEKAINELEDNQISEIIETPSGYHLVMILERSPSLKRSFASMRDKVAQSLINDQTAAYIKALDERYKVVWNLIDDHQSPPR